MTSSLSRVYGTLREALQHKRAVCAFRGGHVVFMCPHVLGHRSGEPYALGFGYFGFRLGKPSGEWEWLALRDLSETQRCGSLWFTAPRGTRPSLAFLDEVDLEVIEEDEPMACAPAPATPVLPS